MAISRQSRDKARQQFEKVNLESKEDMIRDSRLFIIECSKTNDWDAARLFIKKLPELIKEKTISLSEFNIVGYNKDSVFNIINKGDHAEIDSSNTSNKVFATYLHGFCARELSGSLASDSDKLYYTANPDKLPASYPSALEELFSSVDPVKLADDVKEFISGSSHEDRDITPITITGDTPTAITED